MYVCVYLSGVYEYVCCQCLGPRYGVRTGEVLFSSLRGCECALFSSFIFSLSLFFFLPDSFFNTRLFFCSTTATELVRIVYSLPVSHPRFHVRLIERRGEVLALRAVSVSRTRVTVHRAPRGGVRL